MQEQVSIRAHFERFPATVKGAFVLRGADRDPHQVQVRSASVREVGGPPGRSLDLPPITLDVAPNLDLFVPFEFSITELGSGWYGLECDVAIDGRQETVSPGRRFTVPWPRASVRRGTIAVRRTLQVDDGPKVLIDQIDCGADSSRVLYSAEKPADLRLTADGSRVPVLEAAFEDERGRVSAYPLLKTHARLVIEVRGGRGPLELPLP